MSVQQTLTINFNGSAGEETTENYWIRVFVEGQDDVATVADGAAAVDAVFDIEPCEGHIAGQEVEYDPDGDYSNAVPEDGFWPLIAETIEIVTCVVTADYSWDAVVNVVRSHNTEPYNLVIDEGVGTITQVMPVHELVTDSVVFANERVKDLDFPVAGGLATGWAGPVNTASGKPPVVTIKGTTINLSEAATGTLSVQYQTSYDQVTINIPGDITKKELLPAEILVFYHFLVEPLTLTPPDIDETAANDRVVCTRDDKYEVPEDKKKECWETVDKITLCACEDHVASREIIDQAVECPEGWEAGDYYEGTRALVVGYAECVPPVFDDANEPVFYEQNCCKPPPFALPSCATKLSIMKGGKGIVLGPEFYKGLYGPATKIVGVTPADGICGTVEVKQQLNALNCCDGILPVRFVDPTDVINATGTHTLWIGDGEPPFTLLTHNENSWFEGGAMILVTNNRTVNLLTQNACGMVMVEVSDICGRSDSMALRSTLGQWVLVDSWIDTATPYQPPNCPAAAGLKALDETDIEWDSGTSAFSYTHGELRVTEKQEQRFAVSSVPNTTRCSAAPPSAIDLAIAADALACLPAGSRVIDRYSWLSVTLCSLNLYLVNAGYWSHFVYVVPRAHYIYNWEC